MFDDEEVEYAAESNCGDGAGGDVDPTTMVFNGWFGDEVGTLIVSVLPGDVMEFAKGMLSEVETPRLTDTDGVNSGVGAGVDGYDGDELGK